MKLTRSERASLLLRWLETGPEFSDLSILAADIVENGAGCMLPEQRRFAAQAFATLARRWLSTCIIPNVIALVPELHRKQREAEERAETRFENLPEQGGGR